MFILNPVYLVASLFYPALMQGLADSGVPVMIWIPLPH